MPSRNSTQVARRNFSAGSAKSGMAGTSSARRLTIRHITSAIAHLGELPGSSANSIKSYLSKQLQGWMPNIAEVKHVLARAVASKRVDVKDNKFKINMAYYSPEQVKARVMSRRRAAERRGRRRRYRRRGGRKRRRIYRKSRFARRRRHRTSGRKRPRRYRPSRYARRRRR